MKHVLEINEKQMSNSWKERMFALFDAINRSGVDNMQWGVCENVNDTRYCFGTTAVIRLPGKWLYVYTDEDGESPLGRWSERQPDPDYEMSVDCDEYEAMNNRSVQFYKLSD